MVAKVKRLAAAEPPPVVVAVPQSMSGKEPWYRSILTDHYGDFDLGAILVGIVILTMCVLEYVDVKINHKNFDPEKFGIGVGAVLVGFAGYKFGDAKRAPGTTTTTAVQTISTAPKD